MSDQEFIELLEYCYYTPDMHASEGDDSDDLYTQHIDGAIKLNYDPDEEDYFEFLERHLGPINEVKKVAELTESYKVVHFPRFDKYVRMHGAYNSYEGYTSWSSRDDTYGNYNGYGTKASDWEIVEPVEVTVIEYKKKQ